MLSRERSQFHHHIEQERKAREYWEKVAKGLQSEVMLLRGMLVEMEERSIADTVKIEDGDEIILAPAPPPSPIVEVDHASSASCDMDMDMSIPAIINDSSIVRPTALGPISPSLYANSEDFIADATATATAAVTPATAMTA